MPETPSPRLSILITAGPTHEPIDQVRYLGNRSSGRLGLAMAEEAARRGHDTMLLLGPTPMSPTETTHIALERFRTTDDLQSLLRAHWPRFDVLIMAAAVSDFRPKFPMVDGKIHRLASGLTLDLEPTPDLLTDLASLTRVNQTIVGFALEEESGLVPAALEKMDRKKLDAIVANPLQTMDSQTIDATLLYQGGRREIAPRGMPKESFASWLLDRIETIQLKKQREIGLG
ncbi:MAG: hypothetical protein O7G85_12290 [Planctomycetota bacterium]|nr:hypothetical protein [Planctomycetota bacterium]